MGRRTRGFAIVVVLLGLWVLLSRTRSGPRTSLATEHTGELLESTPRTGELRVPSNPPDPAQIEGRGGRRVLGVSEETGAEPSEEWALTILRQADGSPVPFLRFGWFQDQEPVAGPATTDAQGLARISLPGSWDRFMLAPLRADSSPGSFPGSAKDTVIIGWTSAPDGTRKPVTRDRPHPVLRLPTRPVEVVRPSGTGTIEVRVDVGPTYYVDPRPMDGSLLVPGDWTLELCAPAREQVNWMRSEKEPLRTAPNGTHWVRFTTKGTDSVRFFSPPFVLFARVGSARAVAEVSLDGTGPSNPVVLPLKDPIPEAASSQRVMLHMILRTSDGDELPKGRVIAFQDGAFVAATSGTVNVGRANLELPVGVFDLVVNAGPLRAKVFGVEVSPDRDDPLEITLTSPGPGFPLEGVLHIVEGPAPEKASILITGRSGSMIVNPHLTFDEATQTCTFRISELPADLYRLRPIPTSARGTVLPNPLKVQIPGATAEFDYYDRSTLPVYEIEVEDAESGESLDPEDLEITFRQGERRLTGNKYNGSQWCKYIPGRGAVSFRCSLAGYRTATEQDALETKTEYGTLARVRLHPGWSLEVSIRDPWGEPISGVEVFLDGLPQGRTDMDGTFWLSADERPETFAVDAGGWGDIECRYGCLLVDEGGALGSVPVSLWIDPDPSKSEAKLVLDRRKGDSTR